LAGAFEERRHRGLDAAGAGDGGAAHADLDAARRSADEPALEGEGAELVVAALVRAHGGHSFSSHSRTAFCACSRLPACGKARQRGPSRTSSVISSPRWAGRQCRTTACPGAFANSPALT